MSSMNTARGTCPFTVHRHTLLSVTEIKQLARGLTDDADQDEYDAGDGGEDGGAAGVVDDTLLLQLRAVHHVRSQLSSDLFYLRHDCRATSRDRSVPRLPLLRRECRRSVCFATRRLTAVTRP